MRFSHTYTPTQLTYFTRHAWNGCDDDVCHVCIQPRFEGEREREGERGGEREREREGGRGRERGAFNAKDLEQVSV